MHVSRLKCVEIFKTFRDQNTFVLDITIVPVVTSKTKVLEITTGTIVMLLALF